MLVDGAWQGHECVIIAGGASAKDWLHLCEGRKVIAVNWAIKALPYVDVCFVGDFAFYDRDVSGWYGWEDMAGTFVYSGRCNVADWFRCHKQCQVIPSCSDPNPKRWSTSIEDGLIYAYKSGTRAMNLADILQPDVIYLLGFDGYGAGSATTWAGRGQFRPFTDSVWEKAVDELNAIGPQVQTPVVNMNPNSYVTCFPFVEGAPVGT